MIIDCIDESGYLSEQILAKIKQASDEVFRQEFRRFDGNRGDSIKPGDNSSNNGTWKRPDEEANDRLEVSVTITDEETIQAINAEFRNIDKVTDVLSFPQYNDTEEVTAELEKTDAEISIPLGDVVICYKRACEQALEYGNSVEREITYLFVHSMMHLLGYDHMEEEERRVMRTHEERVMDAIDLKRA